ncbi:hypothetical protein J4E85_003449 [Alternaria conjuncta]|uniref:uncharacterized protein n=1 Tax=Alternaria conjuncta TaxID=181017 RepID=UPI00221E8532|nr:uncharacterized protein J4E85_003449 [Alternaria conjuncta]KAI4933046.1 hypothetical protein J4E85_003449 [Alternaria conjuncta]
MAVLRACSPIATALLALLLLRKPVTAVPHNHGHKHVHRHVSSANDLITLGPESLARRDTPVKLGDQERMKEAEVAGMAAGCFSGNWPLDESVPMPIVDPGDQLNLFPRPESKPNTLTMYNYCPYDLYFEHWNAGGPFEDKGGSKLAAGASVSRGLTGTVIKVFKSKPLLWPFLIEYGGQYDMSLIHCLGTTNGNPLVHSEDKTQTIIKDTSRCPGHEAGLHLSQPEGRTFQCEAGLWCDDQAYLYEVSY